MIVAARRGAAVKAVAFVAVVGAVVTVDVVNKLTVNSQAGGKVVMAETTVAFLRIVGLDSMARWHKMTAISLAVEYLMRC